MNRHLTRWPLPLPWPVFAPEGDGAGAGATQAAGGGSDTIAAGGGTSTQSAGAGADTGAGGKPADTALTRTETGDGKAAGDWPADWREKMATGADGKVDAKLVDRLKRYASPIAFGQAGIEAQNRIQSGKVADDVPMPADPEGAKKWRTERGIPEDATGYKIPDPVATRMTPEDKPVLESFTAFAHSKNAPPAFVEMAAEWYVGMQEEAAAATNEADKKAADATEDALRSEWGDEFRANKTVAMRYATEAIPGVEWFTARLPDGRALGNIPEVVKALAKFGLMEFGDQAFVGGAAAKATESRIAELKGKMTSNIDEWNAHPEWRKEYFDLLEAEQKRSAARGGPQG